MFVLFCDVEFARKSASLEYYTLRLLCRHTRSGRAGSLSRLDPRVARTQPATDRHYRRSRQMRQTAHT